MVEKRQQQQSLSNFDDDQLEGKPTTNRRHMKDAAFKGKQDSQMVDAAQGQQQHQKGASSGKLDNQSHSVRNTDPIDMRETASQLGVAGPIRRPPSQNMKDNVMNQDPLLDDLLPPNPKPQANPNVKQVVEARLADYFAIVGLEDESHPLDGGAEQLKMIEKCEVIVLEKQTVSDAKKHMQITRNQLIRQRMSDHDGTAQTVQPQEVVEIKQRISKLSDEEKTPFDIPVHDPDKERWLDLDGTSNFFLKLTYGTENPITDINFFYISSKMEHKIQIPESMEIQPVPIKRHDDPTADKKFHTVHKKSRTGPDGASKSTAIVFHGTYDLKYYLDRQEPVQPKAGSSTSQLPNSEKILCLCVKRKTKQGDMPIFDVNIIEGEQKVNEKGKKMNYSLPQDSKVVTYRLGHFKQRLMFFQKLDILKTRFKPSVLDRYPPEDRIGYAFSPKISEFCFPHGIVLSQEHMTPQSFSFILTDAEGGHIYGTCLAFSETPSDQIKLKLKQAKVQHADAVWTQKAICILSHYSFMDNFKQILNQIYRMHLSTTLNIPLERFVVNIMDEVPLPDKGNILIQHEIEETISFCRPVDQYPPYASKTCIQNLFKALKVDDVLELVAQLLLERKILIISKYKALLTQVCVALQSLIYPLAWNHTLIPILPAQMIDVLDAPFPFLIGIQAQILQNALNSQHIMLSNEVTQVDLDSSLVYTYESAIQHSKMPRETRQLRDKLVRATAGIQERPDPDLEHVDDAFFKFLLDPDEIENHINEIEVRDAFLEFMQRIMANYHKYLKDPGLNRDGTVPDHANARDFFNFDKFRQERDASKSHTFINKLTHTANFGNFIEARSLGKTDHDEQIMHFDLLLKEKRTNQRRFLVQHFKEKKVVRSMQVNDSNLDSNKTFQYDTFPSKLDPKLLILPRKIQSYVADDTKRSVHQQLVSNDQIHRMHETDWAKYMAEVIYCLWFQVFAATLPMYKAQSKEMIHFARKLLQYITSKLKPLKEVEIIYRRMFEACGTCMQLEEIKELYKEMQQLRHVQVDKVTYGTYYQALVLCQRRTESSLGRESNKQSHQKSSSLGHKEGLGGGESERKSRYMNTEDIEHIEMRSRFEEEKDRLENPYGLSDQATYPQRQSISSANQVFSPANPHKQPDLSTLNEDDFDELFDRHESLGNTQEAKANSRPSSQTRQQTQSNKVKLSQVLENSLYIEICKECMHCEKPLKEEELFSGLQKNNSDYTVKCPHCSCSFVPKFTLYSEYTSDFISGREGLTLQLIPPVALYKEFLNTLGKKGDRVLTQENFLRDHSVVFWNIIVYFKIMKLPCFILDQDYSQKHVRVQVSWIKKYLPDKAAGSTSSKQATRSSFGSKTRLDKDGLNKLDRQQAQSPVRNSSLQRIANGLYNKIKKSATKGPSSQASGGAAGNTTIQNREGDSSLRTDPQNSFVNQSTTTLNMTNNIPLGTSSSAIKNPAMSLGKQPSIGLMNMAKSTAKSVRSGSGTGSVITSTSDLERLERLMDQAKFANKSVIKYFGKQFEEYRREMQYHKEIIMSDLMTQGIPESMVKHAENVNMDDKQSEPFKQAVLARCANKGSNLDNFSVEEPNDYLNMAQRTSNLSSNRGAHSSHSSHSKDAASSKNQLQPPVKLRQQHSMQSVNSSLRVQTDLQQINEGNEHQRERLDEGRSPTNRRLPPKHNMNFTPNKELLAAQSNSPRNPSSLSLQSAYSNLNQKTEIEKLDQPAQDAFFQADLDTGSQQQSKQANPSQGVSTLHKLISNSPSALDRRQEKDSFLSAVSANSAHNSSVQPTLTLTSSSHIRGKKKRSQLITAQLTSDDPNHKSHDM